MKNQSLEVILDGYNVPDEARNILQKVLKDQEAIDKVEIEEFLFKEFIDYYMNNGSAPLRYNWYVDETGERGIAQYKDYVIGLEKYSTGWRRSGLDTNHKWIQNLLSKHNISVVQNYPKAKIHYKKSYKGKSIILNVLGELDSVYASSRLTGDGLRRIESKDLSKGEWSLTITSNLVVVENITYNDKNDLIFDLYFGVGKNANALKVYVQCRPTSNVAEYILTLRTEEIEKLDIQIELAEEEEVDPSPFNYEWKEYLPDPIYEGDSIYISYLSRLYFKLDGMWVNMGKYNSRFQSKALSEFQKYYPDALPCLELSMVRNILETKDS